MSGHPIKDHADSCRMHLIHKVHQILRRAVTGGRRIVTDHLIAPGFIQRMLHHRHQLDVGIAHPLHIINDLRRKLSVGIKFPAVRRLIKGSQIDLVNTHGLIFRLQDLSVFQPLVILPLIIRDIPHHRGAVRSQLRAETVRIRLQVDQSALCLDLKLITVSLLHIGEKNLKNTGIPQTPHLVRSAIPAVKISYHADPQRIRRPHRKCRARHPVKHHRMCAQFLIDGIMNARRKLFRILLCDLRLKIIRVTYFFEASVCCLHHIFVSRNRLSGQKQGKIPLLVGFLHPVTLIAVQKL